METKKYICEFCQETFEISEDKSGAPATCPRCGSRNIRANNACSLEVEAPPWEYECRQCRTVFKVKSPAGPDEAKQIRCPVCQSQEVAWRALATGACATGG